ncbi:8331_t:CDS:2, partial [Racocetra persica]
SPRKMGLYIKINEANLDNCVNSINKFGMPTGSISNRLVHLYSDSTFTNAIYQFASPLTLLEKWDSIPRSVPLKWDDELYHKEYQQLINEANLDSTFTSAIYQVASPLVSNKIIQEYELKTRRSAQDLIMNSHEFPKFAGFHENIFEDFAHRELQKDGLKDLDRSLTWKKDSKNISMYFVVPPDIFETFPRQKYKIIKDEDYQGGIPEWVSGITQYALEINLGIDNKHAKKRSSNTISIDDKGNKDEAVSRKKQKTKEGSGVDIVGETSKSNMSSMYNVKKCSRRGKKR